MKKSLSLILVIFMVLALALTGCGTKSEAPAPEAPKEPEKPQVKVGFIYVGPIGDGGWTYAHNEGKKYLEEQLKVPVIYKESVPEDTAEVEKVINDMIDQGANIIFGTSFGFMEGMKKAAPNHPDVTFMHCSGYEMADNMGNYFGRIYEARYLSGIVAGMKTKSNKVGYVAAYEIPEVVRGINAFTLGVRAANPKATVEVVWTHTWYDPAKEKEAAKALLAKGIDIIAQHQDTAGPQQAAEEKGVWSIGYNTDMKNAAPKAYMTSPVWNWGPYYVKQVKAVMDKSWKAESYWGGMKDGIVDLAPLTDNAPEGAKEKVEQARAEIEAGKTHVFAGPIKDQSGAVKIPEGTTMSDGDLLSIDWFVQGVIGKIE